MEKGVSKAGAFSCFLYLSPLLRGEVGAGAKRRLRVRGEAMTLLNKRISGRSNGFNHPSTREICKPVKAVPGPSPVSHLTMRNDLSPQRSGER
jgi:hypothetical protein